MKKLDAYENLTELQMVKSALEAANIACFIKNEHAIGAIGDLPYTDTWPELWLHEKRDWDRAQQLIQTLKTQPKLPMSDWQCPECQTTIEREFNLCWSCGHVLQLG